ncbi:MAG: ATP phosphoribosyltransferase [bacterium]
MEKLKLGIPKGSLQELTIKILDKAGYKIFISSNSRLYSPEIDDPEISVRLLKPQDMPRFIAEESLDAAITGKDWLEEYRLANYEKAKKIYEVCELNYAKQGFTMVKWVLAVAEESQIKRVEDLEGKRVATELENITKNYFANKGVNVEVEFSWGATEVKVPEFVDAIVELTETGASLKANGLRIIDTVLESTTIFITNKDAYRNKWKHKKMEGIIMLMKGVIEAEGKVLIKARYPRDKYEKGLNILKKEAITTPSFSLGENYVIIEGIINERNLRLLIPKLKEKGSDLIEVFPISKIIW